MGFWEQLEAMPSHYRWLLIPLILLLLGGAYWYFLYQPRAEDIARLEEQITQTRRTLEKHRGIAAKYEEFRARVAQLEEQLRELLTQLPLRREIPDLIRQISDLGVRTGLQISLLRPQPEQPKEFYAEVPIAVTVIGPYHAVGQFFDALSRLQRIVSVSNMQITMNANAKTLETQCLATTFRYLEEDGVSPAAAAEGKEGAKPK
jgi:type IV pilus assembly protein PilO